MQIANITSFPLLASFILFYYICIKNKYMGTRNWELTPLEHIEYYKYISDMDEFGLKKEYRRVSGHSYGPRNMGTIRAAIVQNKFGDEGVKSLFMNPSGLTAYELLTEYNESYES